LWEAGYDIVNDLDSVLQEFDRIVGLEKLYALHLNDSKNPIEAHKDRHEQLGEGHIGKDALEAVITHPALQGKPFILETPNDDAGYAREIAWVRSVMK
jgi:deoxyribonuclease-4